MSRRRRSRYVSNTSFGLVARTSHSCICAHQVAKYAVDISPAQAQPWINLSRAYVANNQFPMALIALNVAPMAHGADFSMPDMPDPARVANINEV